MERSALGIVRIEHDHHRIVEVTPHEMAELAGQSFPISERVPDVAGEAFDWMAWYEAWRRQQGLDGLPQPTHLKVEAADDFTAAMPWDQLENAAVLYASGGAPLPSGGPIRLYAPNGASACLNVKSIVVIRICNTPEGPPEAEYGFRNVIAPSELAKPKPKQKPRGN